MHEREGNYSVRVCSECGSGRTFPLVASNELGQFYPETYNAYALPQNALLRLLATFLFRSRYRRALRRPPLGLLDQLQPGRLLDVGAGRGDLGVVLAARGWKVTGAEPSQEACEEGRRRGMRMVQGTLETVDAAELGEDFDAVVFQHSLEHVVDPREDLARARALLRPGGLLLISLPNFGGWQARAFGSTWFHLDLPRHRAHFTEAGLKRLLSDSEFSDVQLTTSTSADGLPMSVQYAIFGRRRFRSGAPLYLTIGLSLLLVPVSVAFNALGGGDLLHASAAAGTAR
jgi:SAM-dependent methyltransferase